MTNTQHILIMVATNFSQVMDDTDQLSIRRGASLMLRQAPYDLEHELIDEVEKTISIGASIAIFLLNPECKQLAVTKAKTYLAQHKNYCHLTFVVTSQLYDGNYRTSVEQLFSKVKRLQLQQLSFSLPAVLNATQKDQLSCDKDHLRPAVPKTDHDNILGKAASRSCIDRFHYGREQRSQFYKDELKDVTNESDLSRLHVTNDLSKLSHATQLGNLNDKIALVYFDGTQFSKLQKEQCGTIEQQQFDQQQQSNHRAFLHELLSKAMDDDDFLTLEKSEEDKEVTEQTSIRIETLMWGGDELLLVVPAWKGFEVAQLFMDMAKGWKLMKRPVKYDGGIVFCSYDTPIVRIRDLAGELAQGCKDYRKQQTSQNQSSESHWDYLVLESESYPCQSLTEHFAHRYHHMASTRRPLTPPQCAKSPSAPQEPTNVPEHIQYIKQHLPKRQLYGLAQKLTYPEIGSAETDPYAPLKKALNGDGIFREIERRLEELFPTDTPEWRWLHLLELYDYLAPESQDALIIYQTNKEAAL